MEFKLKTNSSEETTDLAIRLGKLLKAGDIMTLEGDLGAGKTTFSKGIALGLSITENVNSPTFTIIKEYQGRLPLYHMDVYRLEGMEDDLGFDEYFYGQGVTIVEWAQFIQDWLPENRLDININYDGNNGRIIQFTPKGERYQTLCRELFE